jgi:hypothetical protein
MGHLEKVLSYELKESTLWPGDELVLPYAEALRAIGIATEHQVAVLGFEAFKVLKDEKNGLQTVDYTGYDVPYTGDWGAYVAATNVEAENWIKHHAYGANHGYILTSASQTEFDQINRTKAVVIEGRPSFETAIGQFQKLITKCSYSEKILWLTPEDVLLSGKTLVYVRVPVPADNEVRARQKYEEGLQGLRGLLISTLCEIPGFTCCFVWFPKTVYEEPQGLWPQDGSVKMTVRIRDARTSAKAVRSRLLWTSLRIRYWSHQGAKEFLFR